ncbi:sensor domain-containing diguanylate cyclase [Muricoccus vinaceus]|uniref:diguanylate cyclase n=1 Tax=Muricoccus vinaceus TaxID=424704 RepID=A0ABV6ISI1_9PROT
MRLIAWFGPAWRHGLAVSAICALFGMTGSALLLHSERARLTADAGSQLAGYARMVAQRLDSGLSNWASVVGMVARFEAFGQQPPDAPRARRLLEDMQRHSTAFSWMGFVDAGGRVVAATDGLLEGADVSRRSWFRVVSAAPPGNTPSALLLAKVVPDQLDNQIDSSLIDVVAPVWNAEGQFVGMVAGRLTWRWAETLRHEVASLAPWQPAPELRVLDSDGVVLIGPENERGRRWPDALQPEGSAERAAWREMAIPGQPDALLAIAQLDATQDRPALELAVVARRDLGAIIARLWPFGILLSINTFGVAVLGGLLAGWHIDRVASALDRVLGSGRSRDVMKRLEQLRDQAWRDPLTGLLNRAGFEAWQATQPDLLQGCAVVVIDLDGFKPVNDLHGHGAGDAVLRSIGRWLQQNLRTEDAAVRLGGDEFVLCLPGETDSVAEAALEVGARLNALLRDGVPSPAGQVRLGCSMGFARVPLDAPDIDAAIEKADAGLYDAKRRRTGSLRNRVSAEGEHSGS